MKKTLMILIPLLLIMIIGFPLFKDYSELEKKRENILEQATAKEKDVSNLLILKDSPIKSIRNDYKFTVFSPDTLIYRDEYLFENSNMKSFGLVSYLYYGDVEELFKREFKYSEKVRFKNVDAYYSGGEIYNEELDYYYVLENLVFFKDKVKYLISWSYVYDGKEKNKMDFLKIFDEKLVLITE